MLSRMDANDDEARELNHVWALEDLRIWAEKLSNPEVAHLRWFHLTVALLKTDVGRDLGALGCVRLAARIVVVELQEAL
jgi:hypothetical protein